MTKGLGSSILVIRKTKRNQLTQQNTDDPALSIDTESIDNKVGRLYRRPEFVLPETLNKKALRELVLEGKLVPSTTNILGVRSTPFLLPWASRVVATEAISMARNNPALFTERVRANYWGAIDFFKKAPERQRDFAGNQGTRIHKAAEVIPQDIELEDFIPTDYEAQSIDAFKAFLDLYQPNYKYYEITGFGQTEENMGYAATTDAILEINGRTLIVDYKCVTDDTPILMPNGSLVKAADLKVGDNIVAHTKEKGLHTAPVSYVGDNGFHQVATITTNSGQQVTTTLNHPFWSSRKNKGLSWVKAEDLRVGDELYAALGWNYSPSRENVEWPYKKNLSPYVLGLLWSLRNYSRQDWRNEKFIELPRISKEGLRDELSEIGFSFNKAGKLNTTNGLAKIARKNKITVEDVFDLIDTPNLPDFVYGADTNHIAAFVSGVQEVFANKEIYEDEIYIVFNNTEALHNLQQFYLNYGQPATLSKDSKARLEYLKVPFEGKDTIFAHGPTATRITSIEITEEVEHTIAIEVAGSHTHITGGLITHNTNRSGLHDDVAFQLAANARCKDIYPDNKTRVDMPKVDGALGIHISPKGVKVTEVDISEPIYDYFKSMRHLWNFSAFEGKLSNPKGVMLRDIKDPQDI